MDKGFAKDWEAYISDRFNSKNSVNIHLRSVQAIVNEAEDTYEELKGP
jgi:integrase/recombinase XerD